ncbi:hypothetical protein JFV29_06960 [Peribacillus sp. TH16]|uniref:hypothetical protein n=1 Tax=Peribacillus sp. TH16 TaxID=2798482 RepID=UPI0019127FD8|nr:hypothetical protein [Peribacillus sp. TH16]MBK5481677.1 hypothetical protein [Peribacillus sp. TH16]
MGNIRWGIISAANIAYDEFLPALIRSDRFSISSCSIEKLRKGQTIQFPAHIWKV